MKAFYKEIFLVTVLSIVFSSFLFVFISSRHLFFLPKKGSLAPGEVVVVIPEGLTAKQIEERLLQAGLDIPEGSVGDLKNEGELFPDTYRFFVYSRPEEVSKKMRANFWRKVGDISREDLILASIVEKEVQTKIDMKKVAAIFKKRLEADIPLQADSTIGYFTGKKNPSASLEDIKIDSPYNTYKYKGLPPGPISNPGLAAIEAVRQTEENPYWYFLTTIQGKVIYSSNLEEHKAAKLKYLDGG